MSRSRRTRHYKPASRARAPRIGGQIDALVADVKGEDSTFRKLGAIELQSLSGQQVRRDRIGAERVQDDEPVRVIRRIAEPQPRIAQDDGDRGRSTVRREM